MENRIGVASVCGFWTLVPGAGAVLERMDILCHFFTGAVTMLEKYLSIGQENLLKFTGFLLFI